MAAKTEKMIVSVVKYGFIYKEIEKVPTASQQVEQGTDTERSEGNAKGPQTKGKAFCAAKIPEGIWSNEKQIWY